MQVLPASGPESVVALQLTAFPVIGKTPPSEQKPTKMTFKLTDIDVKRFLSSVSARDMVDRLSPQCLMISYSLVEVHHSSNKKNVEAQC